MKLSATEKRVLQNIHMLGHMGKCGSLNKAQRLAILRGLITKGLLTEEATLTRDGVRVSAPFAEDMRIFENAR